MLDIYSHFTALDVMRAQLGAQIASGAVSDPRADEAYKALQSDTPYAVLGAVIDHLMAHDGAANAEVTLLEQAHSIWTTVRDFQVDFRNTRTSIEQIAMHPSAPTALADFNAARLNMSVLIERHDQIIATLQAFQWSLRPLAHLTQHPQAFDQPVKSWPWRDVILSRRSGAFTAALMEQSRAIGTPEALAFGVGAISSYAANAIGSAYLLHGVGGPRRSHPYRDRLASYAVGAWLNYVPLPVETDFDRTHALPLFGSSNHPALPGWLRDLILKALSNTYERHAPPNLPDLDTAFAQLIHHWRLLHSFAPLPQSTPIATTLRLRIHSTLTPLDYDRPDADGLGGSGGG
ncbi:MAG: hypothetical protein V4805_00450, partial [Pseudomonadota bacterium]